MKAHAIPRSAGLSAIAEKGHVYGPDYDFMSLVQSKGMPTHKRIGINEASTFTGFCGFHDHTTFEPLENQPLTASPQQCFLMGYRAVCRELFLKRLHFESVKTLRELDRGRSIQHQERVQSIPDLTELGTLLGYAEINYHKSLFDAVLTKSAWNEYHSLVVEFAATPGLLYTGGFAPEFDFSGRALQRALDQPPPLSLITVTVLASENGGLAVLGWENHSDSLCRSFAESLQSLPPEDLGNAIVRLGFEHVENLFARPNWWESLPSNTQEALMRRLLTSAHPDIPRRDCLRNDSLHYVNWPLIRTAIN